MNQDFTLHMEAHSAGKNDFFNVAPFANHVLDRVFMCDADNILLNNRTRIQFGGDVVTCRTDNFHASVVCLMVRLRTNKCRKQRMMNIDNPMRKFVDKIIAQGLHIARQYDEFDVMRLQRFDLLLLLLTFIFLSDMQEMKLSSKALCNRACDFVIAKNNGNFHIPFFGFAPCQNIVQTAIEKLQNYNKAYSGRLLLQRHRSDQ